MGSQTVRHKVVYLEACQCKLTSFDFPHEYVEYWNCEPHQVPERIKDATIVITTVVPITEESIAGASNLQLVTSLATGVDQIDLEACKKRGVVVSNCQGSNVDAVSEHALSLYFAVRRKTVELHNTTVRTDEWSQLGTLAKRFGGLPISCSQETVGVIGYGGLGKRVEAVMKGLGMTVLISDRKGASSLRPGRTALPRLLAKATVVVICCPREPSTIDLIDEAELKTIQKNAILLNVARGKIVNETAVVKALREGLIAGYGTDVFADEPAKRGVSPLLPLDSEVPNLVVSPHLAWYAAGTITNLRRLVKENLESFYQGNPTRRVS